MNKNTFTKGPWQVSTLPIEINNTDTAAAIYGSTSVNNGACLIADISRSPGDREAIANAKLIMFSPDMIEELNANHNFLLNLYTKILQGSELDLTELSQSLRDRMAKQLSIIEKATI